MAESLHIASSGLVFIYDALLDLFTSEELVNLLTIALPWLSSAALAASLLLVSGAAFRLALRTGEASLVSLLYLLSLPVLIARPLLKIAARPDTDPTDEEPDIPAYLAPLDAENAAQDPWEPTAAERVESALLELGVPLSASDLEIKHAYLKQVREHHPKFLQHAPRATQEMSAETLARIRHAYEVAIGKPQQ